MRCVASPVSCYNVLACGQIPLLSGTTKLSEVTAVSTGYFHCTSWKHLLSSGRTEQVNSLHCCGAKSASLAPDSYYSDSTTVIL